jgi:trimeric autotransporter adhesin
MKNLLVISNRNSARLFLALLFTFHFSFFISFCQGQIITTVAGNGITGYSGNGGPATAAEFNFVFRSLLTNSGNLYIDDLGNNCIRMVNPAGIITTIVGDTVAGYSGDGGPATDAELNQPVAIAMDANRNIYISDYNNHRVRVVHTTGIIETYAGNGVGGYSGDGGAATAAEMSDPFGLFVDAAGNLLLMDQGNFRVREVNTSGIIKTVAGNGVGGYSGDGGQATAAEIYYSEEACFDLHGNMYIVDGQRIRKVNSTGIVSTLAGTTNGTRGYYGDGGPASGAEFNNPNSVAVDTANNVYIADEGNSRIRMVNTSGIINTVAGNGTGGFSGDGGSPLLAELNMPCDIKIHNQVMCITDLDNDRVRIVAPCGIAINTSVLQYVS